MTKTASAALSGTPATSLRDRLRADTQGAHEALDASFEGMFEAEGDERYRRFLAMNLRAHEAIEPILADSPLRWKDDEAGTSRLSAARRDTASLGLKPERSIDFPLKHPDLFEALGIAYVLEGSRLGAKFMLRAVKRGAASEIASRPTAYLEASSDARPFASLLERMEAVSPEETEVLRAVDAANATFGFFALCRDGQDRTTDV